MDGVDPVAQSPVTAHNDSPPLGTPRTPSRASGHTRSGSHSNLHDYRTARPDREPSAPWLQETRLQEQTWG